MAEYDFIVVGGGSAGGPIVKRLVEAGYNVLLLEAGPEDSNPWIQVPIGFAKTFLDRRVNWKYVTDEEPQLGGRRIYWPRGKVLGGSSSINGLIYIRGVHSDYDHWRQLGNEGWSFADCLPYFRKLESHPLGDTELHGKDGPIGVSAMGWRTELSEAWIAACLELGFPRNDDFNGPTQEGVGYYHLNTSGARRRSTARTYLASVRERQNCNIVTQALVEAIELDQGRAVGVRYRQHGQVQSARARCEVVVCAGAVNSPQLLQLSGIGPGALLQRHGIDVRRELPGVGENLQDHWGVRSVYRCTRPITINDALGGPLGKAKAGLQYLLTRGGPLTISAGQVGLFARIMPQAADPDIQIHFMPFSADRLDRGPDPFSAFTIFMNQSRPESRGRLQIVSPDPARPPSIVANYMAAQLDMQTTIGGLRLARRIARTATLQPLIAEERLPPPEIESDAELLAYAKANGNSAYHPVGTCRMGHDLMAVVDPRLRVRGLAGLRIADASVMPTLVSGNTNAASMMIGEKAADYILADARAA